MLRAFCNSEDLASLVGRIYLAGRARRACVRGTHSWTDTLGLLPPDTKCDHCDETYGNPDSQHPRGSWVGVVKKARQTIMEGR